jgi:hypothetical protein
VDERINASPMVYAKIMAMIGWYTLSVKKMYLQTESLKNKKRIMQVSIDILAADSGKGVILDSGTTDTYLHNKLDQIFGLVWEKAMGKDYDHKPISCTPDQLNWPQTTIKGFSNTVMWQSTMNLKPSFSYIWMVQLNSSNDM